MIEKKRQLLKSIEEAELVLVGLGKEFIVDDSAFSNWELFQKWKEADKEGNYLWMEPFLKIVWMKEQEGLENQRAYENLAKLLEGKNYFIVTLATDDMIYASGLNGDKIVAPCGSVSKLQCHCTEEIFYFTKEMEQQLKNAVLSGNLAECKPFGCPNCNELLQSNVISAQTYNEAGYLPVWEMYTKWLQGTVNRKVCIIEAGVDFSYPSVIRFPFEKIAFFNQKASFYRIHEKWYQLTEELKDKSTAIACNGKEFFMNLFV